MTLTEPNACRWDGIPKTTHGRRHSPVLGWHTWEPPTVEQRLQRAHARRLALVAEAVLAS